MLARYAVSLQVTSEVLRSAAVLDVVAALAPMCGNIPEIYESYITMVIDPLLASECLHKLFKLTEAPESISCTLVASSRYIRAGG